MIIELTEKELQAHKEAVEQLSLATGCSLAHAEVQIEITASCGRGHLVEIGYFAEQECYEISK